MRLLITQPTAVVVERDDVAHVRAADTTGAFGILPGHADFVTVLDISIVTWRERRGDVAHAAVRGGVLTVTGGNLVEIATREAAMGDSLEDLHANLISLYLQSDLEEEKARTTANRLHASTIRQLQRVLDTTRAPTMPAPVFGSTGKPRADEADGNAP